jgi:hypothetical protein
LPYASERLGFLKSLEREPLMAVLHVYLDESGKQSDHPLIALCCVLAQSSKIDNFQDAWDALLGLYSVVDFHMKRASDYSRSWGILPKQTLGERIEGLKAFTDCICDYLDFGLIQAWDVRGFKAIPPDVRFKIGNPHDPYYLAFVRAIMELADYAKDDDVLSIVCDYDMETAWESYRHYQGLRKASLGVRHKTAALTFADDKYFLALQAADMMAFLTRHEARSRFYGIKNVWLPLFNDMVKDRGATKILWKYMFSDEKKTKNCLQPPSGKGKSQ